VKNAIIIGAGPAGLTAALELLEQKSGIVPIILESTDRIGGISCTIEVRGNRIDIGGHRFFSKSDVVMDWWNRQMPVAKDPEHEDKVMLVRPRISRIFYLRKFFDYPISIKPRTFLNLGLWRTLTAGCGYVLAQVHKRPHEDSLEDFLVNRFGVSLYRMFFEDYTEKVWGVHPSRISAEWGAQRIKGLSLLGAVLAALRKLLPGTSSDIRQKKTETSLIEQFLYPKLGPGQLWETVADKVRAQGGQVLLDHKVVEVQMENNRVQSVVVEHAGERRRIECDYCFSSMPIAELVPALRGIVVPPAITEVATQLPYRDFLTVGVLARKLLMDVPDTWIYIQERDVRLCRLQVFNNWSPYMVKDPAGTVWIGLEYMCSEGDELWNMEEKAFIDFAVQELVRTGILDSSDVLDTCRVQIPKAYPAYFGSYGKFSEVREFLDLVPNLYCIGRNGQHRYNNQDHSMLSAMEAVRCARADSADHSVIWSVNSENEYHESKKNG